MVIPDQSVLYQLGNFLLMWLLLNVLLIKPIRGVIQKRKELMAEQAGKIEKFTADAEGKIKEYEAVLTAARMEGNEVRAGFKEQGSAKEHEIMASAGTEASKILGDARVVLGGEVKNALGSLKKGVDGYAAKAAGKILGH